MRQVEMQRVDYKNGWQSSYWFNFNDVELIKKLGLMHKGYDLSELAKLRNKLLRKKVQLVV